MTNANQDVIVPAKNNALAVLGGYDAADDFKDMRGKDHILPRAMLMQPLSSPVMDGKAQAGEIVDSSTLSVIVPARTEGKYIVPIMMWLEWIEWNRDRDCPKDQKVVARSVDPAGDLAKRADRWEEYIGSDGKKKVAVTEYYNFIVAVVDDKMSDYENLFVMGFARSSHKIGKTLLNRLYKYRIPGADGMPVKAPMFFNRIAIKTQVEQKENNKYWVPVLGDSKPNPDAHLTQLALIATSFRERRSEIIDRNRNDHDDAEVAAGPAGGTASKEM